MVEVLVVEVVEVDVVEVLEVVVVEVVKVLEVVVVEAVVVAEVVEVVEAVVVVETVVVGTSEPRKITKSTGIKGDPWSTTTQFRQACQQALPCIFGGPGQLGAGIKGKLTGVPRRRVSDLIYPYHLPYADLPTDYRRIGKAGHEL